MYCWAGERCEMFCWAGERDVRCFVGLGMKERCGMYCWAGERDVGCFVGLGMGERCRRLGREMWDVLLGWG